MKRKKKLLNKIKIVEDVDTQVVEEVDTQVVEEVDTQVVEEVDTQVVEEVDTQVVEDVDTQVVEDVDTLSNIFINNKSVKIVDNILEIIRENRNTDVIINWIPNYFQGKKLESLSGNISIDMGLEHSYILSNKYISHMFIR